MTNPPHVPEENPRSRPPSLPAIAIRPRLLMAGLLTAVFVSGLALGALVPWLGQGRTEPQATARGAALLVGLPEAGHVSPAARSNERSRTKPSATLPPEAPRDFDLFWQALRIVRDRYVDADGITDTDLTRGAIAGMVDALGDVGHSVYLTPEEVRFERDALDGKVTGIGVFVDSRAGAPSIISVIDGSPADDAGLRAGDLIVSVDGVRVERLGMDELLRRVRGEKGSVVRLEIERQGAARLLEVEVVRDEIVIPSVSWAMVPGTRVADVRLVQFSFGAARELRAALEEAIASGAEGLVLDLRGNPGGLVDEATSVAGAFLSDGAVFQQRDRGGEVTDVGVRGRTVAADVPLVVLVDYGSASSAEIVAAALRGNGRARLVGEQTYGTGTVLNSFGLRDGSALRLGVLRWLTPEGESIFGTGVVPDETVERTPGSQALRPGDLLDLTEAEFAASGDRQLLRAVELLDGSDSAWLR
jgi:carboxyl-terminal processing protease